MSDAQGQAKVKKDDVRQARNQMNNTGYLTALRRRHAPQPTISSEQSYPNANSNEARSRDPPPRVAAVSVGRDRGRSIQVTMSSLAARRPEPRPARKTDDRRRSYTVGALHSHGLIARGSARRTGRQVRQVGSDVRRPNPPSHHEVITQPPIQVPLLSCAPTVHKGDFPRYWHVRVTERADRESASRSLRKKKCSTSLASKSVSPMFSST